jgi:hypothetical protein
LLLRQSPDLVSVIDLAGPTLGAHRIALLAPMAELAHHEVATVGGCTQRTMVTIPGSVFLLPDEVSRQIAEVIASAVAQAS